MIYYPTLKYHPSAFLPSVANLATTININGVDGTTVFVYNGKDATTSTLVATIGTDLSIASSGNDIIPNAGSFLSGSTDDSFQFNNGKVFQAANNSYADIGNNDFYIGLLYRNSSIFGAATSRMILGKRSTNATDPSWQVNEITGANNLYAYANNAADTVYKDINITGTIAYAWNWLEVFCDISETVNANSFKVFCNLSGFTGIKSEGSALGDMSNTNKFTVGSADDFSLLNYDGCLAYAVMAIGSNWFAGGATNPTQWAAFHANRFNQLFSLNSQIYKGTQAPTVSRASPVYSRKVESGAVKYYLIGQNIPRIERTLDASSVSKDALFVEPAATNYCAYSSNINSWTKTLVTTPSAIVNPFPFPGYLVTESSDAADDLHAIFSSTITVSDKNGQTGFSYIVVAPKVGGRDWIRFRVRRTSSGNSACWVHFQFSTKTFGTLYNAADQGYEVLGTFGGVEWLLIWIKWEAVSETTGLGIVVYSAEADDDISYTGDGRGAFYLAFGQIEIESGLTRYSSPIITTTTTAVTRLADSLYYKGDDGNLGGVGSDKQGTIAFELRHPIYTPAANQNILEITDGGATADRILLYVNTSGYIDAQIDASGGTTRTITGPSTSVVDNYIHKVRLVYMAGKAVIVVDETYGTFNTAIVAADIPDDLDRITPVNAGWTDKIRFVRRPIWSAKEYIQ